MSDPIVGKVARYYSGKLADHGASPAGVDWNGPSSQRLRFAELARVVEHEPFTLNDYGCGYGAMAEWLEEHYEAFSYTGYDAAAPMVEEAAARFGSRHAFVNRQEDLPVADYTVASGVFSVKLDTPDAEWHEYVRGIVERMLSLSSRGVAFNMLTSYSDSHKMRPDLHYADPLWWFDWCKRNVSRHVALLHDYGLWEFTIIVKLEEGTS